jgi:hypothetical protein
MAKPLQFTKVLKPRNRQLKYFMYSVSNNGITVYAPKYQPVTPIVKCSRAVFESHNVPTWGWLEFFILTAPCQFRHNGHAYDLAEGAVFMQNQLYEPVPENKVELDIPKNQPFTYTEWRKLRAEVDEIFLAQGQIPE